MIPSRGLRPPRGALGLSRAPRGSCEGWRRQFSSIPQPSSIRSLHSSHRPVVRNCTSWRTSGHATSTFLLSPSAVRHGSWYAPWSWGSSKPSPDGVAATSPGEPAPLGNASTSTVTTATPELAPAGIDRPAVTSELPIANETRTVEDVLSGDWTSNAAEGAASVELPQAIAYWGHMKDLGLDYGWGSSAFVQSLLELSYLNMGYGWVGSIVASTVVIRCILFFGFQMRGSNAGARMAALKPVLTPLMKEMEQAKREGDANRQSALRMKQQYIMKDAGVDAFKSLQTPLVQMVLGFGAFRCLRGMSHLPVPGLSAEQFLWMKDLTVADPTYIMPTMLGIMMYGVIKLGGETGTHADMPLSSMQKYIQIGMPVMMTGINAFQPAAVQIYFFCSIALGAATAILLRQPGFRRFANLAKLPTPEAFAAVKAAGSEGAAATRSPRANPRVITLNRAPKQSPAEAKLRYEAPSPSASSARQQPSKKDKKGKRPDDPSRSPFHPSINVKSGVALPRHMHYMLTPTDSSSSPANGKAVPNAAPPPTGLKGKISQAWAQNNPVAVVRKFVNDYTKDERSLSEQAAAKRRNKMRADKEKYEAERKRRLDSAR